MTRSAPFWTGGSSGFCRRKTMSSCTSKFRLWRADGVTARGILQGNHTNLTLLERDGVPLLQADRQEGQTKRTLQLSVQEIFEFAQEADPRDLEPLTGRQIDCNMAIAQEGMEGSWGASVGKTLRQVYRGGRPFLARAYAAAGSDARMSGCEMPVIIVSGSGNQGITASVPVAIYARAFGIGAGEAAAGRSPGRIW